MLAWSGSTLADGKDKGKPADPPGLVHMTVEQQKTVDMQTASAKEQPITEPVHLPGVVAFDPGHVAVLRPFEQARVIHLLVQPGDVVAARQRLVELDMPGLSNLQQSLAAARASVSEAEAGVAVAKAALNRAVILARDGSMARAEADRRRLVLAQAVAAELTAQTQAATLQTEIGRLDPVDGTGLAVLRSPLPGIVVSVTITPGEVVGAGMTSLTVADLRTVMVIAQIPESEAAKVAVEDKVVVSLTGNQDRTWNGRVATLGAELNPQTRTLPARIEIGNADLTLRAGMYVDVLLTQNLGRESVVVPSAAVQLIADKSVVFTPEGGDRFQAHDVQTGVRRQDSVEILRGLKPGETVVTQGSFQLKALLRQSMLDQQ